jgi:UDP-N-acetylmuramoylalanine--D-glutamate ligase
MKHLDQLHVLVLGLGESGLAMARWCARCGATVRVWDSRESPPQAAALAAQLPQAGRLQGELTDAAFAGVQLVLKSPGLAPGDERIAAALARATGTGLLVQGELDLFVRALADLRAERDYAPKLLAVTGTNGKTTTTAMTALMVERVGHTVAVAGNIGPTMLQTLADRLDLADAAEPPRPLPQVWVLELSSFQLDAATGFEPDAATVLNITEDHLDWHGSMAAYVAAKARVFGQSTVMVINRDDPAVEQLVPQPRSGQQKGTPRASAKGRHAKPIERTVLRFGLDAPRRPGDFGLVVEGGMAWLVRAMAADETIKRGKGMVDGEELHLQRLMPADALRVRGRHNAANALAALALASAIGCPLGPMLHALREYAGEPHRVAFVASLGGVDAFDDSKGTNVGATVAALNGLGEDRVPARLVVILGGDGKGQDFAPLRGPVQRHARAVATLGRDAERIEQALSGLDLPLRRHDSLPAATRWCFEQARPGDAVLLSPACASLDMFRNYGHRAEVFVSAVQALATERGEVV